MEYKLPRHKSVEIDCHLKIPHKPAVWCNMFCKGKTLLHIMVKTDVSLPALICNLSLAPIRLPLDFFFFFSDMKVERINWVRFWIQGSVFSFSSFFFFQEECFLFSFSSRLGKVITAHKQVISLWSMGISFTGFFPVAVSTEHTFTATWKKKNFPNDFYAKQHQLSFDWSWFV